MVGRRIPLVAIEAVARIVGVQSIHQTVPCDLRHDRCGRNRGTLPIALHHATLRHGQRRNAKRIDEHRVWKGRQRQHGPLHRLQRGLVNVDRVDLLGARPRQPPSHRPRDDRVVEPIAAYSRQRLRIRQPRNMPSRIEHDGARHHRPGQAAAPDLVDARDTHEPVAPQARFRSCVSPRPSSRRMQSSAQDDSRGHAPHLRHRLTTLVFTSFMRAALPFSSRRKYSLARRTLAERTTSTF